MIKEVKMHTVICDNCNEDLGDNSEYSSRGDESQAWDNADESGWYKEDSENNEEKHYCPKCVRI